MKCVFGVLVGGFMGWLSVGVFCSFVMLDFAYMSPSRWGEPGRALAMCWIIVVAALGGIGAKASSMRG